MIEKAIRARLLDDATVAALVAARVYPGVLPQRPTMPAIVLTKVDKLSPLTMDGAAGPNEVRVQVDCWDDDVDGVRDLAAAVNGNDDQSSRGPLHGFGGIVGGEDLKLVRLLAERATDYEPDTKLYRVGADYMVHL